MTTVQKINRWNWFPLPHHSNQNHRTPEMLDDICIEYQLVIFKAERLGQEINRAMDKYKQEAERLRQKAEALMRDLERCS